MNLKDTINLINLWDYLGEFVRQVCAERDSSHGYDHMAAVAKRALFILAEETNNDSALYDPIYKEMFIKVMIVAMLHDVADHKYDIDGTLQKQVNEFIMTIYNEGETRDVLKIIEFISYSKEQNAINKETPIDFDKELGFMNTMIRHIVSDADKCEAIGKSGLYRVIDYTQHAYNLKHNVDISYYELKKQVIEHSNEKLLRLKNHFIRTNTGKEIANKLHDEFVLELQDLFDIE